jgi:hypothetical protein
MGRDGLTFYVGPEDLRSALELNQAEPLSLASADFEEKTIFPGFRSVKAV